MRATGRAKIPAVVEVWGLGVGGWGLGVGVCGWGWGLGLWDWGLKFLGFCGVDNGLKVFDGYHGGRREDAGE